VDPEDDAMVRQPIVWTVARGQSRPMSYADFVRFGPDEQQAEWVDGQVFVLTQTTHHQLLSRLVVLFLSSFVALFDLGKVFGQKFLMRARPDGPGRQPDAVVVLKAHAHRIKRIGMEGPADLVVELLSGETATTDQTVKVQEYAEAGIPEYLLIEAREGRTGFWFSRLILQRQLCVLGVGRLGEGVEDAGPDARLAPARVAAVDGLPGAESRGQVAPGGPGPRHPEDARQGGAVVVAGAAGRRTLRRQERGDARPGRVGQDEPGGAHDLDRRGVARHRLPPRPPGGVAALGHGLVAAPEARPPQPEGNPARRLGQRQEQAADLRDRQREQVGWPPFWSSSPAAWRRVAAR